MISNNSQTHPDESQLKMCHLCTFKTLKDKALFYHIEVKHEKKTRFNCDRCDRQFYFEHQMKPTNTPLLWTSFMDIPWGRGSWLSFTSSCLLAPRREIPHALKLIAIARATMKGSNSTPSFETPLQRGVCSPQLVGINFESLNINLCYYSRLWNRRSPWNKRSPPS